MDWDATAYGGFSDLRLRPALDLLARIPMQEAREAVDLGCGAGAAAPALRARFPTARLIGVDPSPAMREKATATGLYHSVLDADAAAFAAGQSAPDLLFSNAALHWAADHGTLFPALLERVAPGGVFALQAPRQFAEPSHRLLWRTARDLHPDRFEAAPPTPLVGEPGYYRALLAPRSSALDLWETIYHQKLEPTADGAHPIAAFTRSTAARPYLERLSEAERPAFLAAYAEALQEVYPREPDGGAWLPFRRLFIVMRRPASP